MKIIFGRKNLERQQDDKPVCKRLRGDYGTKITKAGDGHPKEAASN